MIFALTVTVIMAMLMPLGAYATEVPQGLSASQFESALRNISTAPNYILVTVVNGNTGQQESVCFEAQALLTALYLEHNLRLAEATAFALAQPDRTFRFSDTNALRLVYRAYSDQVLQEARDYISKMTADEIRIATSNQESKFYEFCAREPGAFGVRFPAIAHALTERGILCGRSCKPGLFYIENETAQQAGAGYPPQGVGSPDP